MSETQSIKEGDVVSIHYTLTGDDGTVIDNSGANPHLYLHGANNIVAGLESQLTGKNVGDKLVAVVPPVDGYGELSGEEPIELPRTNLPEGDIQVGMPFHVQTEDGQQFALWVVKIEGDSVFLNANHPMAGVTLNFDVEVIAVRDATDEEKTHGHPHGPGGHHH
jgi:FKBP-type peptidyl-prolyl cis-trans isomerase SlyD